MSRGTTDTVSTKRADPSGNGQRGVSPFRLESPRRKVQIPQLMIAVFLVALCALVIVILFSRAAARDPILAFANPVERGQVVAADDLMVVYVATDDPITSLPSDAAAGLVGLASVADLDAGTIVTPAHFTSRSVLDVGDGVVGLALAPGEYPTPLLAPGDVVDVVVTSRSSVQMGVTAGDTVVASAVVFDIAEMGTRGERFISLQMSAGAAAEVAGAAAADQVRLVLVAGLDQ